MVRLVDFCVRHPQRHSRPRVNIFQASKAEPTAQQAQSSAERLQRELIPNLWSFERYVDLLKQEAISGIAVDPSLAFEVSCKAIHMLDVLFDLSTVNIGMLNVFRKASRSFARRCVYSADTGPSSFVPHLEGSVVRRSILGILHGVGVTVAVFSAIAHFSRVEAEGEYISMPNFPEAGTSIIESSPQSMAYLIFQSCRQGVLTEAIAVLLTPSGIKCSFLGARTSIEEDALIRRITKHYERSHRASVGVLEMS
jgi:hypothetical protein